MQMAEYRFTPPKTSEEDETCVVSAIPKSKKTEEKVVSHVTASLEPKCISKVADRSKRQGRNQ